MLRERSGDVPSLVVGDMTVHVRVGEVLVVVGCEGGLGHHREGMSGLVEEGADGMTLRCQPSRTISTEAGLEEKKVR